MIPLFKIYNDKSDISAIEKVVKSGMFWATGDEISRFESKISQYIGTKYSTVMNSGTSALVAALIACDIREGDEVIVPSFTFIATAFAVSAVGGIPIFTDIEEKTCGLDPADIEKKITKKTRAIIVVHYSGYPCQIEKIKKLAKKSGVILIEDAAEAFGAKVDGKMIGSFGDISIFSFCQNKIITTGEGGAIVTDSYPLQRKIKQIISHGRNYPGKFFENKKPIDYISLGHNWRMSSITAALGLSQIKKTEHNIKERIRIAKYYQEKLSKIDGVSFLEGMEEAKNVFQMFPIRARNRDSLAKFLDSQKIASRVCFSPVHKCYYYKNKTYLPATEKISKEILTLPIYPKMAQRDLKLVVKSVSEFYK